MQQNDISKKRRLIIDNEEIPGLVSTGAVKDTKETTEAPGFKRKHEISTGVKKFEPMDVVYKISKDTITKKFLWDWHDKDEVKDVVVINTDGTGEEIDRWLLPDCEFADFDEGDYDASGVVFFAVTGRIICTGTPTRLDA